MTNHIQGVQGLKQPRQKAYHSHPSTESNFTVKFVKLLLMATAPFHNHLM